MRRSLQILIFTLMTGLSQAQSPNWLWASSATGTDNENAFSIAVDASGNSYTTGTFGGSSITFGSTILTNANVPYADIFIVKYDASGNVVWAKRAGGTQADYGSSIVVDGSGNIYLTGNFYSSNITFGSTTLTNSGTLSYDIFVVKYDASGNVLWAKSGGGTDSDYGRNIAVDDGGNIYITGNFYSSTLDFGSNTLTNINSDTSDVFITKYDASGNVLWTKSAGGTYHDIGSSIATDGNGNVYLTGVFGSSSISFGTTTLTNSKVFYNDVFIVKYDASGNVLWAKGAGGSDYDDGTSIITDGSGNVYVTGYSESYTLNLGSSTLTNIGIINLFVIKYDALGNILWARNTSGASNIIFARNIKVDGSGNSYVTGNFQNSTFTFGSTTLTNLGYSDIFVVKYDASGNTSWAKSAGGTYFDDGYSIAVDGSGNSYVTGFFKSPTITFGSTTLTNTNGTNSDVFIAKLDNVLGIEEKKSENSISLYPNPTNGKFTIENKELKIKNIEVLNNLGEKVISEQPKANNANGLSLITIDLSQHPAGIYIIKLQTDEGIEVKKIVMSR